MPHKGVQIFGLKGVWWVFAFDEIVVHLLKTKKL